jgi:hypothetical protein
MVVVGAVLIGAGLLGFIDNPIVGEKANDPLFVTGPVHNVVHLATGALAIYIAFGLAGEAQANGIIGFGVLYLLILVLTIISPNLFGILGSSPDHDVNPLDHGLHLVVGVASIGVGWLARAGRKPGGG